MGFWKGIFGGRYRIWLLPLPQQQQEIAYWFLNNLTVDMDDGEAAHRKDRYRHEPDALKAFFLLLLSGKAIKLRCMCRCGEMEGKEELHEWTRRRKKVENIDKHKQE